MGNVVLDDRVEWFLNLSFFTKLECNDQNKMQVSQIKMRGTWFLNLFFFFIKFDCVGQTEMPIGQTRMLSSTVSNLSFLIMLEYEGQIERPLGQIKTLGRMVSSLVFLGQHYQKISFLVVVATATVMLVIVVVVVIVISCCHWSSLHVFVLVTIVQSPSFSLSVLVQSFHRRRCQFQVPLFSQLVL